MNWSEPYTPEVSLLDAILEKAKSLKSTDIHLGTNLPPGIRVDKQLIAYESLGCLKPEDMETIIGQVTTDQQRETLVQLGEVDLAYTKEPYGRYRINIYKQLNGYAIALRAITVKVPDFESLKLPSQIKDFASLHKGLVLVTGATGSGKSTTLASLLKLINQTRQQHIITIEDPVEYIHQGEKCRINQREIGTHTHSFANALRAALREDPDVILVGEMRDSETISIALTAAETGHLVFSTLHTVGAAKTVDRIIDSFPTDQQNQVRSQLATVLMGVVSQELLPKKEGGITAACEVMVVNPAIRNLIRENKPHQITSIIQTSGEAGMQTLDEALYQLIVKGTVDSHEAIQRAVDRESLEKKVQEEGYSGRKTSGESYAFGDLDMTLGTGLGYESKDYKVDYKSYKLEW